MQCTVKWQGRKPAYCAKHRTNGMMHMDYNNFRVYLQNNGELELVQVGRSDKYMCAAFSLEYVPTASSSGTDCEN